MIQKHEKISTDARAMIHSHSNLAEMGAQSGHISFGYVECLSVQQVWLT